MREARPQGLHIVRVHSAEDRTVQTDDPPVPKGAWSS